MKTKNLLIFAAALTSLMVPMAHADTFLQYSTTSSSNTISFNGTTLAGSSIPVNLSYLDPVSGELSTGTLNFSATAVPGTASDAFGFFYGVNVDNITFSITNGATDILSGTAATGQFTGTSAGFFLGAQGPGDVVTFLSSLYGPMTVRGFQIGTGAPSDDLSDAGGTLSSFDASAGTGAFTGTAPVVPEPSSLALLGTGLLAMVGVARRKLAV